MLVRYPSTQTTRDNYNSWFKDAVSQVIGIPNIADIDWNIQYTRDSDNVVFVAPGNGDPHFTPTVTQQIKDHVDSLHPGNSMDIIYVVGPNPVGYTRVIQNM